MNARAIPEALQQAADERFRVHSPAVIESLLRFLIARAEPMLVLYGEPDPLATQPLAIDGPARELVLDYAPRPRAMRRLLEAPRLHFSTRLDQVRIGFEAAAARTGDCGDVPAFRVPLPDSISRLQRRAAYRLQLPASRPSWCGIRAPGVGGEAHPVRMHDISVGGLGLADLPENLPAAPGTVYRGCSVALPDCGTLTLDLQVVHVIAGPGRRAGCRFVDLPPESAALIQRCITRASAPAAGRIVAGLAAPGACSR
jgi:c-di-GMP-binding flagellar brake protein YcgR